MQLRRATGCCWMQVHRMGRKPSAKIELFHGKLRLEVPIPPLLKIRKPWFRSRAPDRRYPPVSLAL